MSVFGDCGRAKPRIVDQMVFQNDPIRKLLSGSNFMSWNCADVSRCFSAQMRAVFHGPK